MGGAFLYQVLVKQAFKRIDRRTVDGKRLTPPSGKGLFPDGHLLIDLILISANSSMDRQAGMEIKVDIWKIFHISTLLYLRNYIDDKLV